MRAGGREKRRWCGGGRGASSDNCCGGISESVVLGRILVAIKRSCYAEVEAGDLEDVCAAYTRYGMMKRSCDDHGGTYKRWDAVLF